MNVRRSLLLAALVALLATQGARGGFLDSVTEGLGNAVASVTGAVTGAAGERGGSAANAAVGRGAGGKSSPNKR